MDGSLIAALAAGATLGLPSGLAPGPLLTDLPVILVGLLLLGALQDARWLFGAISTVGGGYVLFLAWETWRAGPLRVDTLPEPPRSLRKGVVVNLLNPHVYLFWGTVGVPLMLRLGGGEAFPAWAFAGSFFACLVGGKIGVAWLVGGARHLLEGRGYRLTMRGLGLVLAAFGLLLLSDALKFFGAWPA